MKENLKTLENFSKENDISFQSLIGESFGEGDFSFRKDPYTILIDENSDPISNVLSKITFVELATVHRFSNSLAQLCNAIRFCNNNGVKNIVVPKAWYIPEGIHECEHGLRILDKPRRCGRII